MEGAGDYLALLLRSELDEVHGVTGHADGKLRVLLGVYHGVLQRCALKHVDVDVVAGGVEVGPWYRSKTGCSIPRNS